jgi:hypothetical protein
MLDIRNAYKILVEKREWKRSLGRPRRRWKNNIGMYLIGIECCGVGWIHVTQDRDQWWAVVNTVMNIRVQ